MAEIEPFDYSAELSLSRLRLMEVLKVAAPTRQLEKIGLKLTILNRAQWDRAEFAGICMANGCDRPTAGVIAYELGCMGERYTTIRPLKDWEQFRAACRMVGVRADEVPPL